MVHLVTHKSDAARLYYMNLLTQEKSIQDYQNEVKRMTNETIEMYSNEKISSVNLAIIQRTLQETLFTIVLYVALISILIYQITLFLCFRKSNTNSIKLYEWV